jgi:hypothetical protein
MHQPNTYHLPVYEKVSEHKTLHASDVRLQRTFGSGFFKDGPHQGSCLQFAVITVTTSFCVLWRPTSVNTDKYGD